MIHYRAMRICIFGAGAVGGHIAARLAAAGNDVSVVARGAHLQAMRSRGLKLLHGDETILGRVRAAESQEAARRSRPPLARKLLDIDKRSAGIALSGKAVISSTGASTPSVRAPCGAS